MTTTTSTTTTSIRIDRSTHKKLRKIAEREHKSIGSIVDDFVTSYERDTFREQMMKDFQALRGDPDASAEYDAETTLWDQTAGDGLETELPYYDDHEDQS